MNESVSSIPVRALDNLAEGWEDEATWQTLREIEINTRKYLLSSFYRKAEQIEPRPLVCFGNVLLTELEQASPEGAQELLVHPSTGSWLAHVLRKMAGYENEEDEPLWATLGYFNTLVAAHAFRHKVACNIFVPVCNGKVFLPTLGTARVPSSDAYEIGVLCSSDTSLFIDTPAGNIEVSDVNLQSSNWQPVHTISLYAKQTDQKLCVLLDDADPYNNGTDYRLSDDEATQWREVLEQAWDKLQTIDPATARELSRGLSVIVPAPQRKPFEAYSSSTNTSIGSIRASLPTSPEAALETLLHEYSGHSKLNKIMNVLNVNKPDDRGATLYAPWRDDPRPSGGVLHGIYSFSRVVDFYDNYRKIVPDDSPEANLADFERLLWSEQVLTATDQLKKLWHNVRLLRHEAIVQYGPDYRYYTDTSLGTFYRAPPNQQYQDRFLRTVHYHLGRERRQQVSETIGNLVTLARQDHRALWLAHHSRPDSTIVERELAQWLRKDGHDVHFGLHVPKEIKPDPDACRLDARAILMRHFILDTDVFEAEYEKTSDLRQRADCALILGKNAVAQACYEVLLKQDPFDVSALIGLGHSIREIDLPGSRGLLRHGARVLALQRHMQKEGAELHPLILARSYG